MYRRRRRRRMERIWIFLIIAAVLFLVAMALVKGFKIRQVSVEGNSRYSSEKITTDLKLNDFPTNNSLFAAWKYRHAQESSDVPYLNSVQIRLVSPGNIRIIVSEKVPVGGVLYSGKYATFDENGTVLTTGRDTLEAGIPLISGVSMDEPQEYQKLPADDTALLNNVLKITQLLRDSQLNVSTIEFDENLNITLTIGTVQAELGRAEYLEQKVSALTSLYDQIKDQTGTLNMSAYTGNSEQIAFHSDDETEAPTEPPESETADIADDAGTGEDYYDTSAEDGYSEDSYSDDTSQWDDSSYYSDDYSDDSYYSEDYSDDSYEVTGVAGFQVFDSSGTLHNDARVINGQVVDAYGNPIDGCTVQDDGNVKDAYWNVIDPQTGTLAQ